ncbi:hypothetical protein [Caloranaerobacter sp. DY30410]|uniref:hypothetical protein n=1 Tax=Caloranaerobacter sp. DY30410 TaxID=3238305 RepID=UPI003D0778F0
MKDIYMFCETQDCVCDDICCQECNKLKNCDIRCEPVKFKEKIYSNAEYLIEKLEDTAIESDNWIISIAIEKIKELKSLNRELVEFIKEAREYFVEEIGECCWTAHIDELLEKAKEVE